MNRLDNPSKKFLTWLIVLSLIVAVFLPLSAYSQADEVSYAIRNAVEYLRSNQNEDGSIGGFANSIWVTLALVAAGENPYSWRIDDGPSIVDYLKSRVKGVDDVFSWEKLILAAVSVGENPYNLSGVNCVEKLKKFYDGIQIGDPKLLNDDFWGLMALVAAGENVDSKEVKSIREYILKNQNKDGGWSFALNSTSDPDDTAAAIMALIAAGENKSSPAIIKALSFLKSKQTSDGGFAWIGGSNSISTAWVICALKAVDENPYNWVKDGKNPVQFLLSLQNSDGSFNWTKLNRMNPIYTTACAIQALAGKPYPIKNPQQTHGKKMFSWRSLGILQVKDPKVYVRVEGSTETLYEDWVNLPGKVNVTASSEKVYTLEPCPLTALYIATNGNVGVNDAWYPGWDLFVDSVYGEANQGYYGWMYLVNYNVPPPCGCGFSWLTSFGPLKDGDEILWYYSTRTPLKLIVSDNEVYVNENFTVTVYYLYLDLDTWQYSWKPIKDADIYVDGKIYGKTDDNGKLILSFSSTGEYWIYAKKAGNYVKSGKVKVKVSTPPEITKLLKIRREAEEILASTGNVSATYEFLVSNGLIRENITSIPDYLINTLTKFYGSKLEMYPTFEGRIQLLKVLGIENVTITKEVEILKPNRTLSLSEVPKVLEEAKNILSSEGVNEAYKFLVENGLIVRQLPSITDETTRMLLIQAYGKKLEMYPTFEGRIQLLKILGIEAT